MTHEDGHGEDSKAFGPWLGRQLRRKGMSQSDLAAALDVTRAAVSAWITGRAAPRTDKIQAIEELLGLATGASVTRDEAPDSIGSVTWHLRPAHPDGGRELGNAAAFAFDSSLAILTREATQNSLDERHDRARPVRVRFILHEITGERLRRLQEALRWDDLLPHIQASADPRQKVGRVLADGLRELREHGRLLLLRIDDYNANGLTGPEYADGRFAAVVRRQLDSHKSGSAGGSYGLGKATLWATSRFGLVIANSTLSEDYEGRRERRLVGRVDLPWHELDGEQYAGPAWLGERDPDRPGAARSWWAGERTVEELYLTRASGDPGTGFLIVGAHDPSGEAGSLEEMHRVLVRALASGFWASMVSGRGSAPILEASVEALRDGRVVVQEERIDPHRYETARARAVRAFLNRETVSTPETPDSVVEVPVPLTVPPRKDAADPQQAEHRATLLVTSAAAEDERPNRLVCMRGTRMTVIDRSVPDLPAGAAPFQAVLLVGDAAGGEEADAAEAFLRAAEPPEHNDWKATEDLTSSYARGAISRLREFRKHMVEQVRQTVRPTFSGVSADRDVPTVVTDLLKLDPQPSPRSPGYPTVASAVGQVRDDGAWHIRVELRLPPRDDPWALRPSLRFAAHSGPGLEASWSELRPESHCAISDNGDLVCTPGARRAVFTGISDVGSHPVDARMAIAEVDLIRVRKASR
jgi:transcriptional regulator with XRE-family HTH domain